MLSDPNYPMPTEWKYQHHFCICPKVLEKRSTDSDKDPSAVCFSQGYATCNDTRAVFNKERKNCAIRSKRSVHRHKNNMERLFALSNADLSRRQNLRYKVSVSSLQPPIYTYKYMA